MKDQYFSVIIVTDQITKQLGSSQDNPVTGYSLEHIVKNAYLWALWNIWPSEDITRPPTISGIANHKNDLLQIAQQYTPSNKIEFDNESEFNWLLTQRAKSKLPVISYQKKTQNIIFVSGKTISSSFVT